MPQLRSIVTACLAVWACFYCSCAGTTWREVSAPVFTHNTATGETKQTGDAAKPAFVSTADTKTEIPLPPGSVITVTTPAQISDAARPQDIQGLPVAKVTEHRESISTPVSFPPPTPPSAMELAKAGSFKWFGIVGLLFIVAAAPLGYFGHIKAAMVCVGAGICVPLIGQFLSHDWALYATIGLGCVAGTLYVAWRFVLPRVKDEHK